MVQGPRHFKRSPRSTHTKAPVMFDYLVRSQAPRLLIQTLRATLDVQHPIVRNFPGEWPTLNGSRPFGFT